MQKIILSLKSLFLLSFLFNGLFSYSQVGKIDMSFNPDDKGFIRDIGIHNGYLYGKVNSILELKNGKILIGGEFSEYNRNKGIKNFIRLNSDGSLDSLFNNCREVNGIINTIALQSDEKIIVAGNFTSYNGKDLNRILRLNPDGTIDESFNIGSGFDGNVYEIAIQSDGKIVGVGSFENYNGNTLSGVVRINSDGSIDDTFQTGVGWKVVYCLAIQSDGKIMIGGQFLNFNNSVARNIVRLNNDGSIDNTFNKETGWTMGTGNEVRDILILNDNKILIAGAFSRYNNIYKNRIARLNSDGTLDNSFDASKVLKGSLSTIRTLIALDDGKYMIGGYFDNGNNRRYFMRLNNNGSLDSTFSKPFEHPGPQVYCSHLCSNGKILIGGVFSNFGSRYYCKGIVRINSDGSFDNSFHKNTGLNGIVHSIKVIDNNKKIVVGGFYSLNDSMSYSILKMNEDGTMDSTFKGRNIFFKSYANFDQIGIVTIQNDKKILVGGSFSNINSKTINNSCVTRLNSDGSIDSTFKTSFHSSVGIGAIVQQSDGKIWVGGSFRNYGDFYPDNIVKLNIDGTIDTSFKQGTGFNSGILDIAIQTDNKILFGGNFTNYDGKQLNRLCRLNQDGTIDNTFNIGSGFNSSVHVIKIQPDGKIIVAGNFTSFNNVKVNRIIRLNPDGSIDSLFNSGKGADKEISDVKIQYDGKILIGGSFNSYNNYFKSYLCRLNKDGSIDSTFDLGSGVDGRITTIDLENNGNILIGGDFTSINNIGRNFIARLMGDSYGENCVFKTSFENIKDFDCQTSVGTATAKAYHGKEPFTYNWLNASSFNNSIATFNQSGIYTCLVTDANGCSDTASLWIAGSKYPEGFDLNSSLVNSNPFRTGFDVKLTINAINLGCVNQTGQIKLVLDSLVSYQSATPSPDFISGDTLVWNFSNLYYLSSPFTLKVNLKTNVTAAIGDTVHLQTIITPIEGDADASNNIRDYHFPVINGYDPNDISVNPQGICPEGYIKNDETLTYTVRFQNTGNAEAVNIAVVDSLNSNLDINTLRVISASDTMYTLFEPGNVVKFMFDSIMLKDSLNFEPESHGYVVFEIKPKRGLTDGTIIKNKVGIYFDFNPAVVTNTVLNTTYSNSNQLTCTPTSTEKINSSKLQLYPNPSEGIFNLVSTSIPQNISVYDQTGKLLFRLVPSQVHNTLDLSKNVNGIYIIQVESINGTEVIKAIINK